MPKLPDATVLGEPDFRMSGRPIATVDLTGYGKGLEKLGAGIANAGDSLMAAAQRKASANDALTYAQAKAQFLPANIELQNSFDDDKDYNTFEQRYQAQATKARDDAASLITNPRYKAQFMAETADDLARGHINVRNQARGKEADVGLAGMGDSLNTLRDTIAKTTDPKDKIKLIDTANQSIDAAYGKGWISAQEAEKQRREWGVKYGKDYVASLTPQEQVKVLGGAAPDYRSRVRQIESGNNPNAVSPTGAFGVYQFTHGTGKQYGISPSSSQAEQDAAFDKLTADNAAYLRQKLGREPTPGELYLAHQQGAGGAVQLLSHPNELAVDVVGEQAVKVNGGAPGMTAAQFAGKWIRKFETGKAGAGGATTAAATTGTPADFIPLPVRQQLLEGAQKDIQHEEKQQQAFENKAAQVTKAGLEKEGYDLMLSDQLTPDWLAQHRDDIGVPTYKTLAHSLATKDEHWGTDPETYLKLLDESHSDPEQAIEDAREAYMGKKIARDVFGTIRSRAEASIKEDMARPWAKDIRSFVRRSMDFGSFTTAAQKERQINAGFAFDDWMQNNPKATRDEAMAQAKQFITDYRHAKRAAARVELPMPTYSPASRETYSLQDIQRDKQTVRDKLARGEITRDEAVRQATVLMQWEKALGSVDDAATERKKPAPADNATGATAIPEPLGRSNPFPETPVKAPTQADRANRGNKELQQFFENQLGTVIDRQQGVEQQ